MGKTLVASVDDLFFRSKIDATARNLNVPVRFVERKDLTAVCQEGKTAAVLLELSNGSSLDAIRALRQNPNCKDVPVIGFLSHVDRDLAREAESAGGTHGMPPRPLSR